MFFLEMQAELARTWLRIAETGARTVTAACIANTEQAGNAIQGAVEASVPKPAVQLPLPFGGGTGWSNPFLPVNPFLQANPFLPTNPFAPSNPFLPANPFAASNPFLSVNPFVARNPFMPANPFLPANPFMPTNPFLPSNPFLAANPMLACMTPMLPMGFPFATGMMGTANPWANLWAPASGGTSSLTNVWRNNPWVALWAKPEPSPPTLTDIFMSNFRTAGGHAAAAILAPLQPKPKAPSWSQSWADAWTWPMGGTDRLH